MKIVAGLGSIDEYIPFVEAGADELFCGYVPLEWEEKYGQQSPLNRREVRNYNVQLGALEELKILRKMVEKYKVPVKLTFNSLTYRPEEYPAIAAIIEKCMEIGYDTFIIADPALWVYLEQRKIPCNIHISGEFGEDNDKMGELFLESAVTRIIFHRKNTVSQMRAMIQKGQRQMEYEAFLLNERCHYTGAYCNSFHCDELCHLCKVPYELAGIRRKIEKRREVCGRGEPEEYVAGSTGCGFCALSQLEEAGITHLKVVGRGNYIEDMEKDISQLKKAVVLLEKRKQQKRFTHDAFQKELRDTILKGKCSGECYYIND